MNPNQIDDQGNTPLHRAVLQGNVAVVRRLLQDPRVDASIVNRHGLTPAAAAAKLNNSQMLEALSAHA